VRIKSENKKHQEQEKITVGMKTKITKSKKNQE
jgi:hypothetical protein